MSDDKEQRTPALKEWSVIVEALGKGWQNIILRKGGIHEGRTGFRPEHDKFLLFPTGFHQHKDKVKPRISGLDTGYDDGQIVIKYWAEVETVEKLIDLESVQKLDSEHYWDAQLIEERFSFGKWEGIYCLRVKVHKLEENLTLEPKPEYGGCKSWLSLPVELPF